MPRVLLFAAILGRCAALIIVGTVLGCYRVEVPDGPGMYRRIQPTDLCLEREIFTATVQDRLAGRLSHESAT